MILVLFYVWEDARVWAHWNHSFDMHLSYLGPVSCSFPSWVLSGCTIGDGNSGWGLGEGVLSPSWVPSELTVGCGGGGLAVVAWWLQHPLFTDLAGNICHSHGPGRKWPSLLTCEPENSVCQLPAWFFQEGFVSIGAIKSALVSWSCLIVSDVMHLVSCFKENRFLFNLLK